MHPLRSSSKHSIVSLLVRRSRFFRFTSFSKKGTFFRTPWLQRLGLLVFPEDKPHFTTASCFSVAHSAWSFLHTSFLLLPSKKKCQGERQSGVPPYLGSPDDLKLLLMKAINRKTPHHGYRTSSGNRLSFQGRWYVCPGLLSRLAGREFDVYYDRRDVGVLYIFVEGEYVGEAYCPQLMGGRVSEWEARAMRKYDEEQARIASEQGLPVRARIQNEAGAARRRRSTEIRANEQARQWDRQREDIHLAEVTERLAEIEASISQAVTLPEAVPDAEPDRPVRILPVRTMREEKRS